MADTKISDELTKEQVKASAEKLIADTGLTKTAIKFDAEGKYIYPQPSARFNLKRTLLAELKAKGYAEDSPEVLRVYEELP